MQYVIALTEQNDEEHPRRNEAAQRHTHEGQKDRVVGHGLAVFQPKQDRRGQEDGGKRQPPPPGTEKGGLILIFRIFKKYRDNFANMYVK